MPFLLERFWAEIQATHGGILLGNIRILLIVMASVGYLLSPIDLIPEALFGAFGLIDDGMVMVGGGITVANFFYNFLVNRNN